MFPKSHFISNVHLSCWSLSCSLEVLIAVFKLIWFPFSVNFVFSIRNNPTYERLFQFSLIFLPPKFYGIHSWYYKNFSIFSQFQFVYFFMCLCLPSLVRNSSSSQITELLNTEDIFFIRQKCPGFGIVVKWTGLETYQRKLEIFFQ